MASLIVIHNIAVLGLFALENITMAEMFGSRNRFTRMAISKEAGGLVAVGFGPVLAGIFLQYDRFMDADCDYAGVLFHYWLNSAILMPEVRDRDLSLLNDAADCAPKPKSVRSGQYI
ncbi:transport protein [Klebsiella grimontii]|uniref:Transport protein n=1 Tax=Klebsiella grimontii TaxID=2058152 RepID=A0A7H4P324_9ENTR|nr:transport protein [Klebsiella grimontii]